MTATLTAPTPATASEPVFRCDCIAEKKRVQAMIYEEIKDMTWEQRHEYFRKHSEEFRAEVARIRAERAKAATSAD